MDLGGHSSSTQHRHSSMAKDKANTQGSEDPFLRFKPSDLQIVSKFFSTCFPFLSKDLCPNCSQFLSDRIRFILPESHNLDENSNNNVQSHEIEKSDNDMTQEDEFGEEDYKSKNNSNLSSMATAKKTSEKPMLPREQREYIRFMNVRRKKDFVCFERVNGRLVNIAEGLELHTGIFSTAEQKRIVDWVTLLQDKGMTGQLKERTYSAPRKWMKGKGRQTLQFGCCYNYSKDRDGNSPGILPDLMVDPMPDLFKVIIRRLISWHVLPPTCVPDSCIVNIYEEGDCIPPHIDSHDFLRPFCTVSFLSECNIAFGSNLKIVGAGEFEGSLSIPLPVGSVLVLNGNGADVAKHCVPAVPTKRISITFRRMDVSKRPNRYVEEPDLLGIQPLVYDEVDKETRSNGSRATPNLQGIQPLVYEAYKKRRSNGSRATPNLQGIQPLENEAYKKRRSNGSRSTPDMQGILKWIQS